METVLERKTGTSLRPVEQPVKQFVNPGISGVWHNLDDVIEEGLDTLTTHYGVDMRELMKIHSKTYQKNAV